MAFQSHIQLSCLSIITFYILLATPCATALNFNIPKIGPKNRNDITTNGDAYISSEGIHLAANKHDTNFEQKAGKATYVKPLHLWDKVSGKLTDFTTNFTFVIDSKGSSSFADGLAFVLQHSGASTTAGGAIGLPINPSTLEPTSQFVAVEFDTYQNTWDPQNITPVTHIGININSIKSNVTRVWYNNIIHGIQNEAVISYRSKSKKLSVVVTSSMNNVKQGLNFLVDLRDYLPERVKFGFSASTGALFEKNVVKSWKFNSAF
ncbi:lectin beta-1 and beta-2 chains-like [Camellia sinensis]|uniref:lectin beta-1 and beta-2 chains-like n=1 Tax=Camellia sinensis TaxID=4442 RepID=UPI001035E26C|nr:lectin beta-1 and beta-2 chains-like [Camellia sinensis]